MENIELHPGQFALFGYGSLISIESLQSTLGRTYEGPFVEAELVGWRRGWDVAMPNKQTFYSETGTERMYPESILYLNVWRQPGSTINGILFVVNQEELAAFDRREWIYDREGITSEIRGAQLTGGNAFVYVGKSQYRVRQVASPESAAVRSTYLQILEKGFRDLGPSFRAEFEGSSDPVPGHLTIADRR